MNRAVKKILFYHDTVGLRGAVTFVLSKITGKRPVLARRFEGIRHPVYVRIGTTDVSVSRQVLVEKQYDYEIKPAPRIIIDAGANIGLAAVFFANKYPNATIFALEPAESNYQMLVKNAQAYPNIKPIRTALWKDDGQISLMDPGYGEHGHQTVMNGDSAAAPTVSVPAVSIAGLMARMNVQRVDLLKIDIEGSEKEVFENSQPWIGSVDAVMAELHEHIRKGCNQAFADATRDFDSVPDQGETVIRQRPMASRQTVANGVNSAGARG